MNTYVKKIGGRLAIFIPEGIATEMELAEGMSMDLTTTHGTLVMRKESKRPKRSLEVIVSQIKPENYRRRRLELGQDGPAGQEAW